EGLAWSNLARSVQLRNAVGQLYTLDAIGFFNQVQMYRQMAGNSILTTPPTVFESSRPMSLTSLVVSGSSAVFTYTTSSGVDTWDTIRVTPPFTSQVRQAKPGELRYMSASTADSFVDNSSSPHHMTIPMDNFTLTPGDRVGVEILILSTDFVPGLSLFVTNF